MNIGRRIQKLREDADMTQKDLAEKINTSYSVMNRIESGERPLRGDEIYKIADVFNVSADYLLGRENIDSQIDYVNSIEIEDPESALAFILQQPNFMAYGGYDLDSMSEDEILELANDMLFAMKLSLEKKRKK